jgi:hypothetical protein
MDAKAAARAELDREGKAGLWNSTDELDAESAQDGAKED